MINFGKIDVHNVHDFTRENSVSANSISDTTLVCAPTKISIEIQEDLVKEILAQAFGCKPEDFTFGFEVDANNVDVTWGKRHETIMSYDGGYTCRLITTLKKDNAEVSVKF